ncbi:Hpt domain-containing protein [Falsiroseomonas bella]|uniref:Hpt domain-containing protein n=1 Tax=Falsiroseomonas bella TaxID=2184016 RepID=UPI001304D50A|nr:Hpt domain-containing protein [Falsiroseomonas bella]
MSPLDPSVAGQLAASLPEEEFRRLLHTFEADLGRLAADCVRAAGDADEAGVRRAAHSLVGAAAAIGASRLEAAARAALEQPFLAPPRDLAERVRTEAVAALAALAALASPGAEAQRAE